ncbi:uncharacterized protein SCHCODRAFT_02617206 [Schizophyllum commune H4-8]|uniref:uncharacterized protein n=1 Tax=Schizophyllum commune (strain H4-8 / FGSC 9210) TaxID=578458 RepID=UPI00215F514B|nr:uncharacterized protein SCHCODRAFT_02617206 [Schizophyllum commune H4-8]KAI5894527.1 hypothetical protein SCHCODRAFT_02617206 [Schizophyllum commune H4-8]
MSYARQASLSDGLPLYLWHERANNDHLHWLVAQLQPYAHQWQEIDFEESPAALSRLRAQDLPCLEGAWITLTDKPLSGNFSSFLSRAPALKELDLRTFEIGPPSPPVIRLPFFSCLTRLVLRCCLCIDLDWFLSVLQACSRTMTSLAMDHAVFVGVPPSSTQSTPITMSALTHLGYNTTSAEFLRCIETPTLEELELNNIGDGDPFPVLSDFIFRLPHAENINDIYLEIMDSEDPEPFLDCVAPLVGLRRVFIMLAEGVSFFTVEALERLSCDAGHQPLLPKLEELCIYHIDGEATPTPAFVGAMREMVRTRAEASRVDSDAVVTLKVFTDFDDLEAVGDGEE